MTKKYDVCIIGSGAGGSPVAYELARAGYKVCVLEKGEFYTQEDFSKDELGISRRKMYIPNLKDEYHIIKQKLQNQEEHTYNANWNFWNGSMVGGSSNLMSGFFHRLKPNDFKLKSVYGEVKGANVEDWPIRYEELERYYDKVEKVVGVSGKIENHKYLETRSSRDLPYEALLENKTTLWFDKAAKSLGLHPLKTPRSILPIAKDGRNPCYYSHFCGGYPCASGAKGSGLVLLQSALRSHKENLDILPNSFVYKLEVDTLDNTPHIKEAKYFNTKDNTKHSIQAKIFVLSAQAIESCRILLNSKSKIFPNGVANNHNQVGKNLIFSSGGVGSGTFYLKDLSAQNREILMERGLFFNRFIDDFYEFKKDGKIYKGGVIDFLFEHPNVIVNALEQMYDEDDNLLYGETLKRKIEENLYQKRVLNFEVFSDYMPTDSTFVSVDANFVDKYDVPVANVNLYSHSRDTEVGEHLSIKAVKILEKMGAKDINYGVSEDPPPNLVAGGLRFGDDIKTSVLDRDCKAHDVSNLYVSDASFMPTGGSVPYTFSIYANAFRVADAIVLKLKYIN